MPAQNQSGGSKGPSGKPRKPTKKELQRSRRNYERVYGKGRAPKR